MSNKVSHMGGFTLNKDEQVIRIIHRHIINVFPVLAAAVLVMIGILAGFYYLGRYGDSLPSFISLGMAVTVLMVLAVVMALIGLAALFIYRQNRIILTSQNLAQIEQFGLFGRKISKLNLSDVQDVSGVCKGFWATIFNYGDIIVQTAGEQDNFVFRQAPDPTGAASFINQVHRQYFDEPDLKL